MIAEYQERSQKPAALSGVTDEALHRSRAQNLDRGRKDLYETASVVRVVLALQPTESGQVANRTHSISRWVNVKISGMAIFLSNH